jgi:uncharacterized protein
VTRWIRKHQSLQISPKGTLRLAVVADTHSEPNPATHGLLQQYAPDAILHAGDIGDLAVLEDLATIAPLHAVRGNIDTHAAALPDAITFELLRGDACVLRMLLVHIGVAGTRIRAEVAKLARSERAKLVICGHSHVPFIGEDRGLAVFNPGSVGPRRFQLPIVFGTFELGPGGLRLGHMSAETGKVWLPH